jgi:hypothetical protein
MIMGFTVGALVVGVLEVTAGAVPLQMGPSSPLVCLSLDEQVMS